MRERGAIFRSLTKKRGLEKLALVCVHPYTGTLWRELAGEELRKAAFSLEWGGGTRLGECWLGSTLSWGEGSGWTWNCLFYKQNYILAERESANDFSLYALMQKDAPWTKQQFDSSSLKVQREGGGGWHSLEKALTCVYFLLRPCLECWLVWTQRGL